MKKQYLSILIILCLLLSMLAGCKKPNAESGALADPQQVVSSSAEQPTDDPITDVLSETPLAVQDLTAEAVYTEEFPLQPPDEEFIRGQMDFSVELFRQIAQKTPCKNTLLCSFFSPRSLLKQILTEYQQRQTRNTRQRERLLRIPLRPYKFRKPRLR